MKRWSTVKTLPKDSLPSIAQLERFVERVTVDANSCGCRIQTVIGYGTSRIFMAIVNFGLMVGHIEGTG